jgi:anti-sigma regulatory factor (Ser/Thr protein kinase)
MTWAFSIKAQTEPRTIRLLRRTIRYFIDQEGASEQDGSDLELVLGEALFNARTHAYHGASGPVRVDVVFDRGTFTLTVHHRSESVPVPAVSCTAPADRERLSLFLISSFVDSVNIRRNEDGTGLGLSITMVKRLQCSDRFANRGGHLSAK